MRRLTRHLRSRKQQRTQAEVNTSIRDNLGELWTVKDEVKFNAEPIRLRTAVLERDGHLCTHPGCGEYAREVHHDSDFGLRAVCQQHKRQPTS